MKIIFVKISIAFNIPYALLQYGLAIPGKAMETGLHTSSDQ